MTDNQNVPNVDAGEIAKFNALAEHWWDPNSLRPARYQPAAPELH